MMLLQDPWYQAAQQTGQGIGNYLMQAADRARLSQSLGAAQKLFEPQLNEQGNLIEANPAQQAGKFLQALSMAGPGGLQAGTEILPLLMKEYQRKATLATANRPRGNPAQGMQRGPRQVTGANQQTQSDSRANEQTFEDTTGSNGGAFPGDTFSPRQTITHPPSNVTGEQHLGQTYPQEIQEPLQQFKVWGPEEAQAATISYLQSGGDADRLTDHLNRERQAVQDYNENLVKSQQIQLQQAELRRSLSDEQDQFLYGGNGKNGQFDRLGWKDPKTQRIATQNFLMQRGKLDERGLPDKETDRKAWLAAEKDTNRYLDARSKLAGMEERTFLNYDRKYDSTKQAAQNFIRTIPNGYQEKTGQYDLDAVNEAMGLLMEGGWLEEEAGDMVTPTSKKSIDAIHKAPKLSRTVTARGGVPSSFMDKEDSQHKRAYQQVARDLIEGGMPQWDNLLTLRRQLYDQKNWDAQDFDNMLDIMRSMGWKESPYQAQQDLSKEIKLSLNEIWDGLTGSSSGGRTLKRLYQRPKEL